MPNLREIKTKLLHLSDRYTFLENEIERLKLENKLLNEKLKDHERLKIELSNQLNIEKRNFKQLKIMETIIEDIWRVTVKEKKYCPICNHDFMVFLPFGESSRKNAECPNCGSLERHRLCYLYLEKSNVFERNIKLLHFAPEEIFAKIFSNQDNFDYLPVDLFPGPNVAEQFDIQDIPYKDNSFDLIYCSHVLEHVPDDNKALKELYRVLKPASKKAFAIIQVPINKEFQKTLENDEYNTPELRTIYYGQADHLRYYGNDFPDILKNIGFEVQIFEDSNIQKNLREKYGINEEQLFICSKK